jgi:hypothetical protein
VTPEVTPEITAEPVFSPGTEGVLLGGAVYAIWRDDVSDGTAPGWPEWPQDAIATDPPPLETAPPLVTDPPFETSSPDDGGIVTDADGGSLQVIEPPSQQGLLDTIVGGVVASFLGN